jgi:phage tail-like protein
MLAPAIERLLPAVFRAGVRPGSPLAAVLAVMEALHEPAERELASLDRVFDPRRAPDTFVPLLARWLDLDRLLEERPGGGRGRLTDSIELGRLRELTAAAAYLSRWRGTARGLKLFLETATGTPGFAIDEQVPLAPATEGQGLPRPFHLKVLVPEAAAPLLPLIKRIVELEKPAYVTFETEVGPPSPKPGRRRSGSPQPSPGG